MKTMHGWMALLSSMVALASAQETPGALAAGKSSTMTFHSDTSVLSEQRRVGKPADDFQKVFLAMKIDPQVMTHVMATVDFQLGKQPLLWFSQDKSQVVVDERWFGDLTMVNVTSLEKGKKAVVGKLKEGARKLPPRVIAWFLMRSGVIQTYIHIESTVRLESEKVQGTGYEAVFGGKHLYFTNERNERSFSFRFIIEQDGTMSVEG